MADDPPNQPAAAPEPWVHLRIVAAENRAIYGKEFSLRRGRILIGRGEDCDLVLKDSGISRHHALLEADADGSFSLRDQQSSNGVTVQGLRVEQARLARGQSFTLGTITLELLPDPAAKAGMKPGGGARSGASARKGIGESLAEVPGTLVVRNFEAFLQEARSGRPLEDEGEKVAAEKAKRFYIDDEPDSVWLVAGGEVAIYSLRPDEAAASARRHLFNVPRGGAIFGMATGSSAGRRLIAEARPGSALVRFDSDQLQRSALIPARRKRIAELVEGWVGAMAAVLGRDRTCPAESVAAIPDRELRTAGSAIVKAGAELTWFEISGGLSLSLVDDALFSHDVEGLLFPLPPGCWIRLVGGRTNLRLLPRRTFETIHDPRLWAGLVRFQEGFRRCLPLLAAFANAADVEQLQQRAGEEEEMRGEALDAFESVLAGNSERFRPRRATSEAARLLLACQEVGRFLGFEVRANPATPQQANTEEALRQIATASGFKVRRIKLGDEWWSQDQGPMLGEREADGLPVALLPRSPTAYTCMEPDTGTTRPVTAESAQELAPFGFMFYRPLPARILDRWTLLRFARQGLGLDVRWVVWMALIGGALGTAVPLFTGMAFESAIPQVQAGTLRDLALGLLAMAFGGVFFQAIQKVALLRIQGKMDLTLQAALWDRLLGLPTAFFRGFTAGDLADRAGGISKIRGILAGAGVGALLGSVASLFNAVQMFFYNWKLFLAAAGISLAYSGITFVFSSLQVRFQRQELDRAGELRGFVLQLIACVAKLRVQGAESHAYNAWAKKFIDQRQLTMRARSFSNLVLTLSAGFPLLATGLLFWMLRHLMQQAEETGTKLDFSTGDFLAFMAAFGLFQAALQALADASVSLLQILPNLERLDPILRSLPEAADLHRHPGQLTGRVTLSGIRFRYGDSGPWLINDLTLDIKPGEFVAIVGSSGSGKSTLLRLLLGFETPQTGHVLYDGQDLASLDLKAVRRQLGVVLQDSRLLPVEIYRNIIGASARTLEDAWEAARKASLDKDIRQMPMNMHTQVSEGGTTLSGGQRQRLMIARAVVDQPAVLLLDEATSALDNHSQAIVTQSMRELEVTRIVIAHRLSTIQGADRICYLEGGSIVEEGDYQSLMEKGGKFAALAARQIE
jgi:NHLM bacteriocin system ABC transporter ATP-binding protein